jgi:hypothetical protein
MGVNLSLFAGAGAQFFTNSGSPLTGGLIYSYAAGTTTPLTTYTSSSGAIAHPNPIILDSAGRVNEIWVSEGLSYKFVLKDSVGVLIGTFDNINGTYVAADLANTSNPALGDALVGFRQSNSAGNLTGSVGKTVHQKFQEFVSLKDFGAVGDGSTNDTVAVQAFFNNISSNSYNIIPAGTYLTSNILSTYSNLNNVVIEGEGLIKYTADQTSTEFALRFTDCSDIEIKGLSVDGDAYVVSFLKFISCSRVNVHHSKFSKFWNGTTAPLADGMAIYTEKSYQVNICNNQFYRVNRGVVFDESSTTTSNVEINDNDFYEMGFGCITLPHKNVNCIGNTMTYCSLGPFTRAWNSYTRTDMRNNAWIPIVNTASMYGGGKGPAINAGSGLYDNTNTWFPFPENVNCSNNVIKYVAEYGIGFEGARYLDAINFAGPNININISNNIIEQTGITAIFITAVKGANISNNIIKNPCFNSASDPAILLVARNVAATFSGLPLADRQLNGVYNAIINGNTVVDTLGKLAISINCGPGNTQGAFTDNMISNNLFEMSKADCKGIIITQDAAVSNDVGIVHIINNWHTNDAGSAFPYVFFENFNPRDSIISGNHAYQMGGATFGYISYTKASDFKYVSGTPQFDPTVVSTTIPQNPGGTVAYVKAKDVTTSSQPYAILNFIAENLNGPSGAFIGASGQGSAGAGLPANLVLGQQVNSTTWRVTALIDTTGALKPGADNTYSLGTSANRWSVVYAATGAINTSDEREKQDIKDLSDAERQVAVAVKGLIKSFRFKNAVEQKGEKARIHFGVMAQQVAEAFKDAGLDPENYAMFCYDEWEDDEIAGVTAGNRYGIRYDELLAFVISAL